MPAIAKSRPLYMHMREILFCLHEFVINDSLKNCLKGLYCNQPLWAGGCHAAARKFARLLFITHKKLKA
jgi:hypothetical protein